MYKQTISQFFIKHSPAALFVVSMLLLAFQIAGYAQAKDPRTVVVEFYKFDEAHSQTFNRKNIDLRKKWLTPELYGLFLNELKREKEYLKQNPGDKPYFGDGLPFHTWSETCRESRYTVRKQTRVGRSAISGNRATVGVTFAFPKPCKDPDATVFTIRLVRSSGEWLIDNVIYSEDNDLVKDLSRTEY